MWFVSVSFSIKVDRQKLILLHQLFETTLNRLNETLFQTILKLFSFFEILPWDSAFGFMFQICQILYFANAFRLDLVESFPTWEPYIEHSFGVWDTKSRALTTGQKQNSNSILWDLQQPCENMMSGQAGDKLLGNSNHNKMQLHVFYKRGRWSHC